MEIKFLGGASEVGRLGMLLSGGDPTLLFDYGVQPTDPPQYPLEAPPVEALLLTHSHLDHCGMVPVISRRYDADIIATPVTFDVAKVLLEDSIKVSKNEGFPQPFTREDIRSVGKNAVTIDYGDLLRMGNVEVDVHSAGHIPGSCMFEVNAEQTVLFTGDLQTMDTRLVKGAQPVGCDVLVIESTYAGRSHTSRQETERAFLGKVGDIVERGGVAVVPCFAVARTQEILMSLADSDYEVWLDGMGREVSQLYQRHPSYLRSRHELRRALLRTEVVRSASGREAALRGDVIVTTGGMMDGGPVLFYLGRLKDDSRNGVLLTGYQVEGTNGRRLLEHGSIEIHGVRTKIDCEVESFDFSAHAGHEQLVEFIDACDPATVVLMHGDSREALAEALEGRASLLPTEGEWHTI